MTFVPLAAKFWFTFLHKSKERDTNPISDTTPLSPGELFGNSHEKIYSPFSIACLSLWAHTGSFSHHPGHQHQWKHLKKPGKTQFLCPEGGGRLRAKLDYHKPAGCCQFWGFWRKPAEWLRGWWDEGERKENVERTKYTLLGQLMPKGKFKSWQAGGSQEPRKK